MAGRARRPASGEGVGRRGPVAAGAWAQGGPGSRAGLGQREPAKGGGRGGGRARRRDVGEEALAELRAYYQEMTGAETGDRLFERTMWYCSADDGWVVKGASAAELYGIATEK